MNLRGLPWIVGFVMLPTIAVKAAQEDSPFSKPNIVRNAMDNGDLARPVQAVSQIFDESLAKSQQANVQVPKPVTDPHIIEFREAVPRFLDAVVPFQSAVLSGGDSGKYAKVIEKQTDVFLRYTKWMGSKAHRPNTSELEKVKPNLRSGEMILSLNRTLTNLTEVLNDDKNPTSSIRQLEILQSFELETYRLKWLSSHLP